MYVQDIILRQFSGSSGVIFAKILKSYSPDVAPLVRVRRFSLFGMNLFVLLQYVFQYYVFVY